ncbi:hypothetical protein Tco_1133528 [Tanacetum coccineum]
MVFEKKVNIKPVNYALLNQLSEDFGKHFVSQQELSAEQAFHLQMSNPSTDSSDPSTVKVDVPSELPKVSLVNESLKKLKSYLTKFNSVVKTRITLSTLIEDRLNEITEVHTIFDQMETAVQQYSVDKRCLEIANNQVLSENDHLLEQIISQVIVNIVVNSSENMNASVTVNEKTIEMCHTCLDLEAKLFKRHNMVKKDEYNKLSKSYSQLEQHCISLELAMQLNKEIFQKNNTSTNHTEPTFNQFFEFNNLKAELQAKDTTIKKLKAHIKRVNETSTSESVKKDIYEIETINIELEHRPSSVRAKEHTESLVNQLNQKSIEVTDLNAQLQEKVFVITTLKNDLRKLKGKDIVDNAAQVSNATTISPGMYKLDPLILAPKDKNNRETHIYYLKHTICNTPKLGRSGIRVRGVLLQDQ